MQDCITPANELAQALAWEYEFLCESYDRSVCYGRKDGVAIPLNGRQQILVSRHAREVYKTIRYKAEVLGIDFAEVKRIIAHTPNILSHPPRAEIRVQIESIEVHLDTTFEEAW